MTIKEFILKLFCIKPEIKNYQVKPITVNKKKYKTLYVSILCERYEKELNTLTCGHCKSTITGIYRLIHLSHYLIDSGAERFSFEELQSFCEDCFKYEILSNERYVQKRRRRNRFNKLNQ